MWTINPIQDYWSQKRKTVWESKDIFPIQRKIVDFHKDFYIQKHLKISLPPQLLQNTWKNYVADVRHKAFESKPGDISTW